MTQRESSRRKSRRVAFCGIMSGLGAALMMAGGLFPIATYCVPMAAGLLLWVTLIEYGKTPAWMVWAVTAALALMLGADKEAAFFYLFLGWYPIVKPAMDRIRPKAASAAAKAGLFLALVSAMYAFLCLVLHLDAVVKDFTEAAAWINGLFFVLFTGCMLLYDRTLPRFAWLYIKKLRPRLPKLG